jgi:hypothetical protein
MQAEVGRRCSHGCVGFQPCRAFLGAALVVVSLVGCRADPATKRESIYDLKSNPTPENIAAIRAMAGDADRDVRATALNALVGLDVDDAVPFWPCKH